MKTKILLIIIVLSAIGVFGFVQSRKMSKTSTQYSQWIASATSLSQSFDKATAEKFFKKKTVKHIGLGDFPSFSRDTLYVKFDKDFEIETYNDGVLITSFGFSDTMNAICLLYGIASHAIQCNPVDYGQLNKYKQEIDKMRALQYTFDVMRQIAGQSYLKLLRSEVERTRNMKEYAMMDNAQLAGTHCYSVLNKSFGQTSSTSDIELRNFRLHLAAGFQICDSWHGDSAAAWECKMRMYDRIFFVFASRFFS